MSKRIHTAAWVVGIGLLVPAGSAGQSATPALPCGPGERLVYQVRVAPMGTVGRGTLSVQGPESIRGHDTFRLRFDFSAKVGPFYPHERRWQVAGGEAGRAPTDAPLDERSLLYYVRTLPLTDDVEFRLERHFDPERYRGEGRIRLHLLEDERRTPIRIHTSLPNAGAITLELDSMWHGAPRAVVAARPGAMRRPDAAGESKP